MQDLFAKTNSNIAFQELEKALNSQEWFDESGSIHGKASYPVVLEKGRSMGSAWMHSFDHPGGVVCAIYFADQKGSKGITTLPESWEKIVIRTRTPGKGWLEKTLARNNLDGTATVFKTIA